MLTQLNPQLQQRLGYSMSEIATFCQRWYITELSLFGSLLGNQFHSDSDIDILIRLAPNTRQGLLSLTKQNMTPRRSPVFLVEQKSDFIGVRGDRAIHQTTL